MWSGGKKGSVIVPLIILPQRTIALTDAVKKTRPGILKTQKQANDGAKCLNCSGFQPFFFFFIISPISKIFLSTHFQYVYNCANKLDI